MKRNTFSYEGAKAFYSARWPTAAAPYLHLEPYLRCWLDPERIFEGKRVLDVGAGECTYTRLIADRFRPKAIVACDLFPERMLPAARATRNGGVKFVAGDAFRLPFPAASFDVIWGGGVLSQLPNLEDALSELGRVLATPGAYVGWEPNPFNPAITCHHFFRPQSPTQYLFWPSRVRPAFERAEFALTIRYYYGRHPTIRNRFLATCVGILARRGV